VGTVRLELKLTTQAEWLRLFDPRDWTIFVPTPAIPIPNTPLELDVDLSGWRVTLQGTVVDARTTPEPAGVVVALDGSERDKINYLNGFLRGALLNHREKRRLPVRLACTYGAIQGPEHTFTKDVNEDGLFLLTDQPLPETSQVHMLLTVPGQPQPLSLVGKVSHTVLLHDDEPPGMGIVFELDDAQRTQLAAIVKALEEQLQQGYGTGP
jgi:hypothetical protein